jgi:transcriptional regulator with XRE-family HTH domain
LLNPGYPGGVAGETTELGSRLRALRTERGLSLSIVAQATDISSSFLSLVETGKNDITFGRLRRLIDFYDVALDALLPPVDDPVVVRAGAHRHVRSPEEGIDVFVLVPGHRDERLYAVLAVYDPDSELAEAAPKIDGTVLLMVLEGVIELELAGSPAITLGEGDSAHFSGARERRITTGPDGGARFIFVASPPPSRTTYVAAGGTIESDSP